MSEIIWIILGYLTIGMGFVEGIRWARSKWKLPGQDKFAMLLVFFGWPFVILLSFVLIWRRKK